MSAVRRFGSGGPWEATYGYSRAVTVGPMDPDHLVEVEVEAYREVSP